VPSDAPPDHEWLGELDAEAPFIDKEWLETVRFRSGIELRAGDPGASGTYEVVGLLGTGSTSVTFAAVEPGGKQVAIKMELRPWAFSSYVRELPPSIALSPPDPARLRAKLERLVGDPMLDRLVTDYDDLHRTLVDNLHDWPPFDQIRWDSDEAATVMTFGVKLPGTRARLAQLASGAQSRPQTRQWATGTLDLLDRLELDPLFQPARIHENPLYVYGGALLSGYFDEVADAAALARTRLRGRPADREIFVAQGWALAHLLFQLAVEGAERFAELWEAASDGLELA
jgi:hypothetical protein